MSDEWSEGDARYPIGQCVLPAVIDAEARRAAIDDLARLPGSLREAVEGLDEEQLATPYRDGGWSVRQVVHHVADSHMNAYVRVRKALTEDAPVIAAYDEAAWAQLGDAEAPIEWSLGLLESLHARWTMTLGGLGEDAWQRVYVHPESGATSVEAATLLYSWHSRHHLAHITRLREGRGWQANGNDKGA